jgi:hypothetical protein
MIFFLNLLVLPERRRAGSKRASPSAIGGDHRAALGRRARDERIVERVARRRYLNPTLTYKRYDCILCPFLIVTDQYSSSYTPLSSILASFGYLLFTTP